MLTVDGVARPARRAQAATLLARALAPRAPAVMVVVFGEPGMGVAELVDEALAAEAGESRLVRTVTALPWEAGAPYALAGRLLDVLSAGDTPTSAAGEADLGPAVVTVLGALAPGAVVRIQDAEHADAASLRALSSAVHRLPRSDLRLVAVVTAPTGLVSHPAPPADIEPGAETHASIRSRMDVLTDVIRAHREHAVHVPPLTSADVQDLARRRGRALAPSEAARIRNHTRGVTADVAELLAGDVAPTTEPVTPRARAHVTRALADLTPPARRLLTAIICFPDPVEAGTAVRVAGLSGPEDPTGHVDALRAHGLITLRTEDEHLRLDVTTPLLRAAAEEAIPLAERAESHRRAADIAQVPLVKLLQRAAAIIGTDPALATALSEAARAAGDRGRWEDASRAYLAAVRLTSPGPDRGHRLVLAMDAVTAAGDIPRAVGLAHEVESLPASPLQDTALAGLAMHVGRAAEAGYLLDRAWQLATPRLRPAETARVCQRLALDALLDWDGAGIVEWTGRAIAAGGESDVSATEARTMRGLGLAIMGNAEEAAATYRDAGGITGAHGQRAALGLGWTELANDHMHRAVWHLDAAIPTRFHGGSKRISLWAHGWLARAHLALGDWDAAHRIVHTGLDLAESTGISALAPLLHWTATELYATQGQVDLAEEHASRAAEGPGEYTTAVVPAALAHAQVGRGHNDTQAILGALRPLVELRRRAELDRPGFWPWQDLYAEALIREGHLEEADAFLLPLERDAASRGHRSTLARLHTVRGRWLDAKGRLQQSLDAYAAAHDQLSGLTLPYQKAMTTFAHGATLRRAGRRREATTVLRSAGELFVRLGATTYVERCGRELSAAAARPDAGTPADLTPQEAQVARLVALGRRNREIAAELYISPKTVEYHLTRLYTKLGLRSRGELTAWMQRADA